MTRRSNERRWIAASSVLISGLLEKLPASVAREAAVIGASSEGRGPSSLPNGCVPVVMIHVITPIAQTSRAVASSWSTAAASCCC